VVVEGDMITAMAVVVGMEIDMADRDEAPVGMEVGWAMAMGEAEAGVATEGSDEEKQVGVAGEAGSIADQCQSSTHYCRHGLTPDMLATQ